MKRRSLHWGLWSVASTVVVFGSLALQMASSATHVPFVLKANQEVAVVEQYRIARSLLQMSLHIGPGHPSIPHGNWSNTHKSSNPAEARSTIFPEPGIPIELNLHWGGKNHPFEALPASTANAGQTSIIRDLVPRALDQNPHAFAWPISKELRPILPAGTTHIVIKTNAISPKLEGQSMLLVIKPRVAFKYATPGYELLWWFYFWPIYMGILGVYGAWLLHKPKRNRRAKPPLVQKSRTN